jgi:hypothetical protein
MMETMTVGIKSFCEITVTVQNIVIHIKRECAILKGLDNSANQGLKACVYVIKLPVGHSYQ